MKKAFYRKIPVYYNPVNGQIKGRSWISNFLLEITVYIDIQILEIDKQPIWVKVDDEDEYFI